MIFVKQLFTGCDNSTADIGRVLWCVSIVAFVSMAGYSLATGHYVFDPISYGGGLASLIAAGGAALRFKSGTEPGDTH